MRAKSKEWIPFLGEHNKVSDVKKVHLAHAATLKFEGNSEELIKYLLHLSNEMSGVASYVLLE